MDQAFVPEKTSKLVIRVKMDASSNPTASAIRSRESDFEFNPVALAILAVVILILSGVGYYYFSSSNKVLIPSEFNLQSQTLNKSVVDETSVSATSIAIAVAQPVIIEPEVVPHVETDLIEAQAMETGAVAVKVIETEVIEIKAPEIAVELSPTEIVMAEEKTTRIPPSIVSVTTPPAPVADFSDNVKRAQFTNAMNKREPSDIIEGIVPAKMEGLKRVHFFTELLSVKGQVIRHQWLHEGELKSELEFNVRGNRWRVNSSKRLNRAAIGNWQVNVLNEAGDILISRGFEYKLPDSM